mgnify:CR=1 FL=1
MSYVPYIEKDFRVRFKVMEAPAAAEKGDFVLLLLDCEYSLDELHWTLDQALAVAIPADELEDVLKLPYSGVKWHLFRDLLHNNTNTIPETIQGRSVAVIRKRANATAKATHVAAAVDEYLMNLASSYPVTFKFY